MGVDARIRRRFLEIRSEPIASHFRDPSDVGLKYLTSPGPVLNSRFDFFFRFRFRRYNINFTVFTEGLGVFDEKSKCSFRKRRTQLLATR